MASENQVPTEVSYDEIKERVHALADEHRKHPKDGGLWEAYVRLVDSIKDHIENRSILEILQKRKENNVKAAYKRMAVVEVVWRAYEKNKENRNIEEDDVKKAILEDIMPFNRDMLKYDNREENRFANLFLFEQTKLQKKASAILSETVKVDNRELEDANARIVKILE